MFLGHFAVGFAAKKASPRTPLAILIASAQLVDLLWPLFLLLGIEYVEIAPGDTPVTPLAFISYPYTHSLLTSFGWALLIGGAVYAFRSNVREAFIVGLCVLSHWILDVLSHRPDLPLTPWSDIRVGLGLWYSPVLTSVVEFGLLAAGTFAYWSVAPASAVRRSWPLIAVLAVFYLLNIFGPPPPSTNMIAVAGNAMWLFVLWAWWVERGARN